MSLPALGSLQRRAEQGQHPRDQVPPQVRAATLAAEDRAYFHEPGVSRITDDVLEALTDAYREAVSKATAARTASGSRVQRFVDHETGYLAWLAATDREWVVKPTRLLDDHYLVRHSEVAGRGNDGLKE